MERGRADDGRRAGAIGERGRGTHAGRVAMRELGRRAPELREELVRRLGRLCGDAHDVEDVAQETLLRALRTLSEARQRVELRPWLMQVARRVLVDRMRRRQVRERTSPEDPALELLAADGSSPEDVLEGGELCDLGGVLVPSLVAERAVRDGLASLRVCDRELLIDHYERGLSCPALAARDGSRPQTVKVRLYRARRRLAAQLDRRLVLTTGVGGGGR